MSIIIRIITNPYLLTAVWIAIGVGVNTAPPHYPTLSGQFGLGTELHSIVQYAISVLLWPLSLWPPAFTDQQWNPL